MGQGPTPPATASSPSAQASPVVRTPAGPPLGIATSPPVVATASPSPSASPTQAEIRATAAKAYLAAATASNKAGDKSFKRYKNVATLAAWHSLYAAYARQSRAFSLAIRAITFPDDTKADVKRLLDRESTAEILEREISVTKSWAQIYALQAKHDTASTASLAAANTGRQDLGLPPPPIN